ncbi:DEAD/DEAH box helicase family protein [Shewanella sp.]|uniref:DEAD/DEAH box helicase family protein n=1 Tax=Shewanella sp. TaxID=50422 RepID=UPI004047678B
MFLSQEIISNCGWQSFERLIARLLIHKGFTGVRVVGGAGDRGADILALATNGKRWLIQAKYWDKPVPEVEVQRTIEAAREYHAHISVLVAKRGVDTKAREFQRRMLSEGKSITIWSPEDLLALTKKLPPPLIRRSQGDYQETAINSVLSMLRSGSPRTGMVIMATGLGKTFTAAEAIRRADIDRKRRVLVLAHTNQLVYQLEKAFWPFIGPAEPTVVWNQNEKPTLETLERSRFIFGSKDSIAIHLSNNGLMPPIDLVVIDECHHAHSKSTAYQKILSELRAGTAHGPQLIGLTATPFLSDPEVELESVFGSTPLVSIDMLYGLRHGFLSQVDYRLYTDNINWKVLHELKGQKLSPGSVNRVFFIKEWDDGVIDEVQKTWLEFKNPKAIVFCGTIDHAVSMRDKINARGFCKAAAIYSGSIQGESMSQYQRNLLLSDFEAGDINVMCTVDVFNEGIDVPDVNIVVFNRVTHSRRIFIQQLGRGLRLARGKEKAIALDFAQDIRRFAAGIKMKRQLSAPAYGTTVTLGNKVVFRNTSGEDSHTESFLNAWLSDVETIEQLGDDDVGVLQFPPALIAR